MVPQRAGGLRVVVGAFHHIPRMMEQYFLPQCFVIEVRIYLCSANVGVAEQFLNHAQVGTSAQQSRGKTVTKGVRRYCFRDACSLSKAFHHDENHDPCKMMAPPVQEYIVFLARLDIHVSAVIEPQIQLMNGALRDRNEPLFVAFAEHPDKALFEEKA